MILVKGVTSMPVYVWKNDCVFCQEQNGKYSISFKNRCKWNEKDFMWNDKDNYSTYESKQNAMIALNRIYLPPIRWI